MRLLILSSLFFFSHLFGNDCIEEPSGSHINIQYQGPEGVGYDNGFVTLSTFIAPDLCLEIQPFIDLRAHYFKKRNWAANAGVGLRYALSEGIAGINIYYDYRQTDHLNSLHQVACGIEWLRNCFDIRVNGYAPFGNRTNSRTPHFHKFEKNTALGKYQILSSLANVDAEVGLALFQNTCGQSLYFAAGGYYLFENKVKPYSLGGKGGGRARLCYHPLNCISLEGEITYDPIFKTRGQGCIRLTTSFGNPSRNSNCCKHTSPCLTQPVYRQEIIPVEKKHVSFDILGCTSNTKIFFVNNLNSNDGTGTYENPFSTLIAAENTSQDGDIVYVMPGSGTSKGMDQGFVMKPNQRLIGSAASLDLHSICVPAQTPGNMPLIENTSADRLESINWPLFAGSATASFGVLMVDNTEVAGLHFDGKNHPIGIETGVGALLHSGNQFTVRENRFSHQKGAGVLSDTASSGGTYTIQCNLIENITEASGGPFGAYGVAFTSNASITNAHFNVCNNIIKTIGSGFASGVICFASESIQGNHFNYCCNELKKVPSFGMFWRAVTANIEDNTFTLCHNTLHQIGSTAQNCAGIFWETEKDLEGNTFICANNTLDQFTSTLLNKGMQWQATLGALSHNQFYCYSNVMNNFKSNDIFGMSWFSDHAFNENIFYCVDNTFDHFAADTETKGMFWESNNDTLYKNEFTCCGNSFDHFGTNDVNAMEWESPTGIDDNKIYCFCNTISHLEGSGIGININAPLTNSTVCISQNTFSNVAVQDVLITNDAGQNTFCVENNHFSTRFELNTNLNGTTSCLRLVGNFIQNLGTYAVINNMDDIFIEGLNDIENLNKNEGNFDEVNGINAELNSCDCRTACCP